MSSATSAVTYTSVYTDSEPGRAFWGADDEEDEHEFPAEEQPLPLVDSPTAESPGYVTESDPKEDPEEYADDEIEDGPLTILWTGEMMEMMMMAIHLGMTPMMRMRMMRTREERRGGEGALANSRPSRLFVVHVDELITIRPQASISLPPEAEVERLLAMTTPSPSPPISLSPPSAGEHLVGDMASICTFSPLYLHLGVQPNQTSE
ncbi:hypothetical protein Tco_1531035 [Tanacetum coccineum]